MALARASSLILAIRLGLLTVAAGATGIAFFQLHGPRSAPAGSVYACPMHPQVRAAQPGDCPICGMALEALTAAPPSAPLQPEGLVDVVKKRELATGVLAPAEVVNGRVEALLRDDEVAGLQTDEAGTFHPAGAPASSIAIRLAGEATVRWDDATSRVTFGTDRPLPEGPGWVELPHLGRRVLIVPTSAVLRLPGGPLVMVQKNEGGDFVPRAVRLGSEQDGFSVVLSGLEPGERLAARTAFFLHAGSRLARGRIEDPAVSQ